MLRKLLLAAGLLAGSLAAPEAAWADGSFGLPGICHPTGPCLSFASLSFYDEFARFGGDCTAGDDGSDDCLTRLGAVGGWLSAIPYVGRYVLHVGFQILFEHAGWMGGGANMTEAHSDGVSPSQFVIQDVSTPPHPREWGAAVGARAISMFVRPSDDPESAFACGAGWDTPCVSVPEPRTWLMMATGLFAIGFMAWRRKEELVT